MKPRLKIVFVQPVQSPYWTERLRTLACHKDLEISLFLERATFAHRPGWFPESIEDIPIEVLGSAVVTSVRQGSDLGFRIDGVRSIPWRLPLALKRHRPDVVVVCNATQVLLALLVKSLLRFKLALIVEDTPHSTRNLGLLQRVLRAWAYRRADRRFALSDDAFAYLKSIKAHKGVVRSSWSLDMRTFNAAEGRLTKSGLNQAARSAQVKTVLFSGRLIELKGVRHLLNSWVQIPPALRTHARLVLAGDGPLKGEATAYCRKANSPDVEFLGSIPYAEMKQRFSEASLFVLPTLQDLFSLTVLEAMASGCPVITTSFNGARELVEDGRTGWIIDPTRQGELTRALTLALSGEVDLREMGRAARARVAALDNSQVMGRFADDIQALCN